MAQEGGDHVTVDYEGAMEQLSQMFGNFERDVIHMCLEQNQGRLEPTIDALLALSTDATADDVNNTANTPSTATGLIDDTFLGGAPLGGGGGGGGGGAPMTQMEKDEALAQMLQQELFMEELSNNAEFMAALEDDHAASERRRRQRQQQRRRESQPTPDTGTSTTLKQKLQNMSDATKRQFRFLSDKFMGRKTSDTERQTNARYSELPSYGAGGGIASNPDYAGELSHRHGRGAEDDDEADGNTCALPLEEGLNLDGTPRQPEGGLHDRRTVRQRGAVAESKKSQ